MEETTNNISSINGNAKNTSGITSKSSKIHQEVDVFNQEAPIPDKKKLGIFTMIMIVVGTLFLLIIGIIVFAYAYYLNEIETPINLQGQEEIKLTINEGMGVEAVSEMLAEEGLIDRPELLQAYMLFNDDKVIQAGYYDIPVIDLNLINLVEIFQKGSFEKKLTFIEGWRVEEYGDYLRTEMGDEFANEFLNSEFTQEGYMFPDTYIIEKDYEPENLASWMRNVYDQRVTDDMIDQAALRGLSEEDVIILASIVEREMNIKSERATVAGILVKRIQNDWALQADAAVQYAKGNEDDWWPIVTGSDTKTIESPYNTYLNKGLPPGPISNPSLSSIESVVNYRSSPYWFYITGNDGITRYAETLEEHNQNIQRYLR